jgi:hypothetical protein
VEPYDIAIPGAAPKTAGSLPFVAPLTLERTIRRDAGMLDRGYPRHVSI